MKKFTTYDGRRTDDGRQVMGIAHLTQRAKNVIEKENSSYRILRYIKHGEVVNWDNTLSLYDPLIVHVVINLIYFG